MCRTNKTLIHLLRQVKQKWVKICMLIRKVIMILLAQVEYEDIQTVDVEVNISVNSLTNNHLTMIFLRKDHQRLNAAVDIAATVFNSKHIVAIIASGKSKFHNSPEAIVRSC